MTEQAEWEKLHIHDRIVKKRVNRKRVQPGFKMQHWIAVLLFKYLSLGPLCLAVVRVGDEQLDYLLVTCERLGFVFPTYLTNAWDSVVNCLILFTDVCPIDLNAGVTSASLPTEMPASMQSLWLNLLPFMPQQWTVFRSHSDLLLPLVSKSESPWLIQNVYDATEHD